MQLCFFVYCTLKCGHICIHNHEQNCVSIEHSRTKTEMSYTYSQS